MPAYQSLSSCCLTCVTRDARRGYAVVDPHVPTRQADFLYVPRQIFNFWFLLSTTSCVALLVYCGLELYFGMGFREMVWLKFPLGFGCGMLWISAVQVW